MKQVYRYIILSLACFFVLQCVSFAQVRILTIGDSTMANYDEEKNSGEKEMRGWAQMFPLFCKEKVKVDNAAKNGRSSKSFYYEYWGVLKESLKPGDYVFIQFGHNDEKADGQDTDETDLTQRGTAAWGQYQKYLERYVNETREKGAIPILFTPIVRRLFNEDNTITGKGRHSLTEIAPDDSTMNYPLAMRSLARQLSVPLIDMTLLTKDFVESYGAEKSKQIIYAQNDNTHLKAMGGILFSELAAKELLRQNILTDCIGPISGIHIQPQNIDFGTQFTEKYSTKVFSLVGMEIIPQTGNIKLSVDSPFSLSRNSNENYAQELSIPYENGNLFSSIFMKFEPNKALNYKQNLKVTVNDIEAKSIPLEAKSISSEGTTPVQAVWTPSEKNQHITKGSISIRTKLVGLQFVNKEETQLLTTTNKIWPAGDIDMNSARYIEFAVSSPKGTLYIDSVDFVLGAMGGKGMYFTALGSTDVSFAEAETFTLMESLQEDKTKTYRFNTIIEVPKGKTFYFRIYPWYRTEASNKFLYVENITIGGLIK